MSIKVIVNGAKGKMGQAAVAAISADKELSLVGKTDLGDDLAKAIKSLKAEVVVLHTPFGRSPKCGDHPECRSKACGRHDRF